MTARTDLSREDFLLKFLSDTFLEAKIAPIAPERKQAVVLPRSAGLR